MYFCAQSLQLHNQFPHWRRKKNCITLSRQRGKKKKEEWERENSLLFCLRRSPDHGTVNVVVFVGLKIIFKHLSSFPILKI